MTYLTITHIDHGDDSAYHAILDALPTTEPDGLLARYAGRSGDQFVITAVWSSKATWDRFATEMLGPAIGNAAGSVTGTARTVEYEASDEFVAVPVTAQ